MNFNPRARVYVGSTHEHITSSPFLTEEEQQVILVAGEHAHGCECVYCKDYWKLVFGLDYIPDVIPEWPEVVMEDPFDEQFAGGIK